jgi:hypothetical protein
MQRSIFDGRPGAIAMPDDFLQSREVVRARITGWWLLDPAAGMNGPRIAIQSELTDEQIAATERLLGWIWERHK